MSTAGTSELTVKVAGRAVNYTLDTVCFDLPLTLGLHDYMKASSPSEILYILNLGVQGACHFRISSPFDDQLDVFVRDSVGDIRSAIQRYGIASAELAYVVPDAESDGILFRIAAPCFRYHEARMVPSFSHTRPYFVAYGQSFRDEEKRSEGLFRFKTHLDYVLRLTCIIHRPAVPALSRGPLYGSAAIPASLFQLPNPPDIRLTVFELPDPPDLRLTFPREGPVNRSLDLWTRSQVLSAASPYFRRLLDLDRAENGEPPAALLLSRWRPIQEEKRAGDESDDSDRDDSTLCAPGTSKPLHPPTGLQYRTVIVTYASYTTYQALLHYLRTGQVAFARLSSRLPDLPPGASKATSTSRPNQASASESATSQHRTVLRPVSPKSLFRLAHRLEIPSLIQKCLDNLREQVEAGLNLGKELSSCTAAAFKEWRMILLRWPPPTSARSSLPFTSAQLRIPNPTNSSSALSSLVALFNGQAANFWINIHRTSLAYNPGTTRALYIIVKD
ncbi:hypothetical protein JCM8097_004935 [Rhodosporidiobolus ruineniae]